VYQNRQIPATRDFTGKARGRTDRLSRGQRQGGLSPFFSIRSPEIIGELPHATPDENRAGSEEPITQAVFVTASWISPACTTVFHRVVMIKATLLLFDIATVVFVLILLRRHFGWSIVYAWSLHRNSRPGFQSHQTDGDKRLSHLWLPGSMKLQRTWPSCSRGEQHLACLSSSRCGLYGRPNAAMSRNAGWRQVFSRWPGSGHSHQR